MSLTRVATNVSALNALNALNRINDNLGTRQLRLATGQRINSAKDDAAGWVIGKGMEARTRGLAQALNNVGDAQSLLGVRVPFRLAPLNLILFVSFTSTVRGYPPHRGGELCL